MERSENVDVRGKGDIAKSYGKAAPLGMSALLLLSVCAVHTRKLRKRGIYRRGTLPIPFVYSGTPALYPSRVS